jgi:hypothetical protein
MFYQKNSKASPETQACGASKGIFQGERAAGMHGHKYLAFILSLLFEEQRRPSLEDADP